MRKGWFKNKNAFQALTMSIGAFVISLVFSWQSPALAHGVYTYAWVDGDTIYTDSYFGAKRKVKGGLIQVFDPSGKMLLEGRTNDQGEFSFKSPKKTDLRIVVEAGMGHRSEYILKTEEQLESPDVEADADVDTVESHKATEGSLDPVSRNAEQIKTIVEQALDSRLTPIKRDLAAIRREKMPGLTEIFSGIGYILGLMGLVMYFRSKKK